MNNDVLNMYTTLYMYGRTVMGILIFMSLCRENVSKFIASQTSINMCIL